MDAGFFDVFHDAGEVDVGAVAEGVNVDFDGVVEEAVDEDGVVGGDFGGSLDVVGEGGFVVDDFHAAAAEDVGGADEDGVADVVGDVFWLRRSWWRCRRRVRGGWRRGVLRRIRRGLRRG